MLRIVSGTDELGGGWVSEQKSRKCSQPFNVSGARAADSGVGIVKSKLASLIVAPKVVVFTIDAHLTAEFQRMLALDPVQHCRYKVAVNRTVLVRMSVAQRRSGATR